VSEAVGRVLATEVRSPIDLPEFDRSVVDGYAVRAADTFGASPGLPALIRVIGEIPMGKGTDLSLETGEAARIATGGMLPAGADAVVMVEFTEAVDPTTVEVTRPVAPGENLVRRGDDVRRGVTILPRGRRLRAPDCGALAGVGVTQVDVYCRPRVAVIPTGDEIVPPHTSPGPGQVRDINTTALTAALLEAGATPFPTAIVRDEPELLRATVAQALAGTDLVLIAGGSSVGTRDWTLEVLLSFPMAELLFHGIAVRPGKPVIAVAIGERLVIGLPGNPVSALLVFHQFVRDVIARLAGETAPGSWLLAPGSWPDVPSQEPGARSQEPGARSRLQARSRLAARMATSCASDAGKEDHVRVRLRWEENERIAEPILGKSALIMPLVQADGLVVIPEGVEGIEAGEAVEVELF
jgi:molybdopterin molybdotransferase